ncbi:MAG: hypothetical protein JXR70_01575 [Spirochaetales bacterium]|nr:hypothetical protein [Spirochaetales bacterium]
MNQMDFPYHNKEKIIVRYKIFRKGDNLFIENAFFPITFIDQSLKTFFMHIANVPEILKAIIFVFKTPSGRGESQHIIQNKEDITVLMGIERRITELSLVTNRNNEYSDYLEFHFDIGEVPMDESKRIPTPAMVWVMDRMQEEYDAWKKEQGD